ncbi:11051_t:CDS:2 [Ambispora gerdemannii]|uniref:11051_t:CDS:1 n=1 Tax=Ambispora gerdemannii TaxID=144530 RepID=A0A9N9AIZ4_9GLOM|nr:11051_t:CDS:2 [Ambispora gerdemannii]
MEIHQKESGALYTSYPNLDTERNLSETQAHEITGNTSKGV